MKRFPLIFLFLFVSMFLVVFLTQAQTQNKQYEHKKTNLSFADQWKFVHSKFERPQLLIKNGVPSYLYVPSGANMAGNEGTAVCILKHTPSNEETTDNLNLSAMLQPADSSSFFSDSLYYNWCNSIIKDQKGIYHLFYSRWPKSIGFFSWLTHSEIAHTTASSPFGPYKRGETVLKSRTGFWDAVTVHNVKVEKFNDLFYMYYTSTNTRPEHLSSIMLEEIGKTGYSHKYWPLLRNNQRTGVAISASLNGPWTRKDNSLIEPGGPIGTVTVNPAVAKGPDGKYYMIIKGDDLTKVPPKAIQAVGISEFPDGPFVIEKKPAFADIPTEDVSMWYDKERKRFYGVFHAHGGNFIGLITSEDGKNWEKAHNYIVCKKEIPMADGSILKVDRMERPFVYIENGKPLLLCVAVKKGNNSFITFFKLQDS